MADDDSGVPETVRSEAAEAYEDVFPAVREGRWRDAAEAGRRVLKLLQRYPDADREFAFRMEKAWSWFALGVEARAGGRLREAVDALRRAADLVPGMQGPSVAAEALNQLALVQADLGDLPRSAATFREALALLRVNPEGQAVLWLGLGRVLERQGDRVGAIHAYSRALLGRLDQVKDEVCEWTHDAYAGIVRCCFAEASPEGQPFWTPWVCAGAWRKVFLGVLSALAGGFFFGAVTAALIADYTLAGWLLGFLAVPMLVILLPSLRKASGPGWAFEMQAQSGVRFAFDLKKPSGEDLKG